MNRYALVLCAVAYTVTRYLGVSSSRKSQLFLLFLFFIADAHMPQSPPSRVHQIRLSCPHAPQQHEHIPIHRHVP